jgi:beta-N-acetylhexosaminidase
VAAVKAGADVVTVPDQVDEVYDALLAAVRNGAIPESRIDESVERILAMKQKAGLFQSFLVDESRVQEVFSHSEDFAFAQQLADSGVVLVRQNGFVLPMKESVHGTSASGDRESGSDNGKLITVLFSDSEQSPLGNTFESEIKARRPDGLIYHVYYDGEGGSSHPEVMEAVDSADRVLLGVFMTNVPGRKYVVNGRIVNVFGLNGPYAQLLSEIVRIAGKKLMAVSLGSPYLILHYPMIQSYSCTFSTSSTSERAAVRALFGEIRNRARLPITLPGVAERGFAIDWPQKMREKLGSAHDDPAQRGVH